MAALDRILLRILKYQLPTMAVLNGHCIAGGLFLSMAHERRIIKEGNWVLTANEVPKGIIVPSGFAAVVKTTVPNVIANQLNLGKRIGVKEALKREVVDATYSDNDDLMKQIHEFVKLEGPRSCSVNHRIATEQTKRHIHRDAIELLGSSIRVETYQAIQAARLMQDMQKAKM